MRVCGNSMRPLLRDGELICIRRPDRYKPGDVVVYQHPKMGLVVHRFFGLLPRNLMLTKGDSCGFFDPPIDRSLLLGVVGDLQIPLVARAVARARWAKFLATPQYARRFNESLALALD